LVCEWQDPDLRACARFRPTWRGLLDARPLEARIRRLWSSYRPAIEIGVVAVDLLGLRPRLFRDQEIGWRHLMASCAVLSGYPQVRIDGRLYSDGGLLGALPLWAAAEMGATRVVAIHALPRMPSLVLRTVLGAIRVLARHRPALHSLEVLTIAPSRPLGPLRRAVFWSQEAIERWIEQGERDARQSPNGCT
jgi:predicted acylesterase/phospholipase RssA